MEIPKGLCFLDGNVIFVMSLNKGEQLLKYIVYRFNIYEFDSFILQRFVGLSGHSWHFLWFSDYAYRY